MAAIPQVALALDATGGLTRALLQGIAEYTRRHSPWQFLTVDGNVAQAIIRLQRLGLAAVIAQVDCDEVDQAICESGLPSLVCRTAGGGAFPGSQLAPRCEISVDTAAAAALAAEHLLDCGLTNFAFVGDSSFGAFRSQEAERGFRRRLGAAERGVRVLSPRQRNGGARAAATLADLAAWLGSLSLPLGLLAASDACGWRVLEACRLAGLTPALDVAVIAIEYDELLCELADPPLSSVALDGAASGYRGAKALRGMIRGDRRRRRLTVGAVGVVHRASTQMAAIKDRHVAEAVHLIRRLAGQQIGVNDIVDGLPISRRALELKFRKTLGYGPYDELQRVRFDRAQRLLLETDLSIPQVASAAGYSSASYLAQVFQRRLGESPAQFRRAQRANCLPPTPNGR